jgi:hypothetical protein
MPVSAAELLGGDDIARRDLPWRSPAVTAWQIPVSAFMLQQTPVARVQPSFPPPELATVIDRFEARARRGRGVRSTKCAASAAAHPDNPAQVGRHDHIVNSQLSKTFC